METQNTVWCRSQEVNSHDWANTPSAWRPQHEDFPIFHDHLVFQLHGHENMGPAFEPCDNNLMLKIRPYSPKTCHFRNQYCSSLWYDTYMIHV